MSSAEIADNQWEAQSIKPPLKSPGAVGQLLLTGGIISIFLYITVMSLVAVFGPEQTGTLADQFQELDSQNTAK